MPNGVPFCTGFSEVFDSYSGYKNVNTPQLVAGTWCQVASPTFDGTEFNKVAGGYSNTIALKTDGTLWTWGQNYAGTLGDNSVVPKSSPVQTVAGGTTWSQISATAGAFFGLKTDGTLWAWGNGTTLAHNSTTARSSPIQTISGGTNWKTLATNPHNGSTPHMAAIKTDGTLWLWGGGTNGVLGNLSTTARSSPVQTVAGGTDWKQVMTGNSTTAAIKIDGTLWSWGFGGNGVLGNYSYANQSSPVQTIAGGTNWRNLGGRVNGASGAIKTDGTLWMWGPRAFGLGDNCACLSAAISPVQTAAGGTNWKTLLNTGSFSLALKTDGTLWTWGLDSSRFFTNSSYGTCCIKSPILSCLSGTWTSVSGASYIFRLTKDNGSLYTLGKNCNGGLGINKAYGATVTKYVDLGKQFIEKDYLIDVYPNLVPQQKASTLWVWGKNTNSLLGNNNTYAQSSPVQTVAGGSNWNSITVGGYNSAAIKNDGTLWLWGDGSYGSFGTNSTTSRSSPVQTISGGTNWKQVTTGYRTTFAIKTDGTLWGWGKNEGGQLADYTRTNRSSPVQTISGGTNWKQVSTAQRIAGAIKTDGTLWMWGCADYGSLGNNIGGYSCRSSPVQTVAGGTNWKQLSVSSRGASAVKTDGTLWSWGCNGSGKLGNNSNAHQSSPVQTISGGTNWKQVSTTETTTGAIKTDGTLWMWGRKFYTGSYVAGTDISSPVQTIAGGSNWKCINVSSAVRTALKTDGTLWVWGCSRYGALANNKNGPYIISSPIQTIAGGTNWKMINTNSGTCSVGAIKEEGDW